MTERSSVKLHGQALLQGLLGDICRRVALKAEDPDPWISTGIPGYDYLLDGGLRPGEVEVLAARPRMGKSAFALQRVLSAAEQGILSSIWSYEMSEEQWVRRAVSALTGLSMKKLRRGELNSIDMEILAECLNYISTLPLTFADTTAPFEEEAELQIMHGSGLFVVDYIQLMDPPEAGSREQEVAKLSRMMKRTAKSKYVAILALAQLNRQAEGKVPQLSDLRESGALESDADIVTFIHREYEEGRPVLNDYGQLIGAKNRDGATGVVPVEYKWREFKFYEMAA